MLKLFKTITPDDFFWNDLPEYFGGNFSAVVQIPNETSCYMLRPSITNSNLNGDITMHLHYKYGLKSEIIKRNSNDEACIYITAKRKPQENIDLMILTRDNNYT